MTDIVECKVIAILDKYTILIDYGRSDGASLKDSVRVIQRGPLVVYDGEEYGSLDNIKAELTIKTIYNNFSVCKNSKTSNAVINNFSQSFLSLYEAQHEELNVNESQIENLDVPEDKIINLGDLVEVIKF